MKHWVCFLFFLVFLFLPHLPPAMLALVFIARGVRPSFSLVNGGEFEVFVCYRDFHFFFRFLCTANLQFLFPEGFGKCLRR